MSIEYIKAGATVVSYVTTKQQLIRDNDLYDLWKPFKEAGRKVFDDACGDTQNIYKLLDVCVSASLADGTDAPKQLPKGFASVVSLPPPVWPVRSNDMAEPFLRWIRAICATVGTDNRASFVCGDARKLQQSDKYKAGTISVPVAAYFNGQVVTNTSFVYHYHPGVKSEGKGGAAGSSSGHFKPNDHAPSYINVSESDANLTFSMKQEARKLARAYKG